MGQATIAYIRAHISSRSREPLFASKRISAQPNLRCPMTSARKAGRNR